jgi:hypothetical protein
MFRNRRGVFMAVFAGILSRAFAFPPSLNLSRLEPLIDVTFYIKCYMARKALAAQGIFGHRTARSAEENQFSERKKRCSASKKQPM